MEQTSLIENVLNPKVINAILNFFNNLERPGYVIIVLLIGVYVWRHWGENQIPKHIEEIKKYTKELSEKIENILKILKKK